MSSYTEHAHASIGLHVMEDAPVKAKIHNNLGTPTLVIDAGESSVTLFFWGPEAPAKMTTIRDAIDAWLLVTAK